jgi:ABC-type lipoprotein release transport system permease subunit
LNAFHEALGTLFGLTLVFLGIAGALGATRLMRALLYQTEPFDLVTFASVPGILGIVALLACYLPARRAAMVEPVTALRAE